MTSKVAFMQIMLSFIVNSRDKDSVKNLYYIHRFVPSSIARLFGVSHTTILNIVKKDKDVTMILDTECLLCGLEGIKTFYIDGNNKNKNPQNVIMLCEADKRRLAHMQIRRREGSLIPQA